MKKNSNRKLNFFCKPSIKPIILEYKKPIKTIPSLATGQPQPTTLNPAALVPQAVIEEVGVGTIQTYIPDPGHISGFNRISNLKSNSDVSSPDVLIPLTSPSKSTTLEKSSNSTFSIHTNDLFTKLDQEDDQGSSSSDQFEILEINPYLPHPKKQYRH